MSKFTFLHAADLHLGSPFQGLSLKDEELARRFAFASREAFRSLVDAAMRDVRPNGEEPRKLDR